MTIDNMRGVFHPSEEHYKAFARVCQAAEAPCEHPEQARGNDPFCLKCLPCRAGMAVLGLVQLAEEHKKKGT